MPADVKQLFDSGQLAAAIASQTVIELVAKIVKPPIV